MLAGYDLATLARGFAVSTSTIVFWGLAAVVVGPVLGVGAAWARGTDPRRVALGVAPLAGILIGEAAYGLTVVAGSTDPRYWIGQAIVGAVAIAWVGVRTRSLVSILLCALAAAAIAVMFGAAYSGDLLALI